MITGRGALSALVVLLAAVLAAPASAQQSYVEISGTVTDAGGTGVGGAAVKIPALNVGATTREDGSYRIRVPSSEVTGTAVEIVAERGSQATRKSITPTPGARIVQPLNLDDQGRTPAPAAPTAPNQ